MGNVVPRISRPLAQHPGLCGQRFGEWYRYLDCLYCESPDTMTFRSVRWRENSVARGKASTTWWTTDWEYTTMSTLLWVPGCLCLLAASISWGRPIPTLSSFKLICTVAPKARARDSLRMMAQGPLRSARSHAYPWQVWPKTKRREKMEVKSIHFKELPRLRTSTLA